MSMLTLEMWHSTGFPNGTALRVRLPRNSQGLNSGEQNRFYLDRGGARAVVSAIYSPASRNGAWRTRSAPRKRCSSRTM